jgi:hypothetical protein
VTTPDTSAVRAWAKDNGYEVADRGRLPAEVTDAYLAANGKGRTKASPAKKAAPARKAAPAKKPVPAKRATTVVKEKPAQAPVVQEEVVPAKPAPKPAAPATTGTPQPRPVSDDRRLVALGEEIAALTRRVEELEKSAGSSKSAAKGTARFRRRS